MTMMMKKRYHLTTQEIEKYSQAMINSVFGESEGDVIQEAENEVENGNEVEVKKEPKAKKESKGKSSDDEIDVDDMSNSEKLGLVRQVVNSMDEEDEGDYAKFAKAFIALSKKMEEEMEGGEKASTEDLENILEAEAEAGKSNADMKKGSTVRMINKNDIIIDFKTLHRFILSLAKRNAKTPETKLRKELVILYGGSKKQVPGLIRPVLNKLKEETVEIDKK